MTFTFLFILSFENNVYKDIVHSLQKLSKLLNLNLNESISCLYKCTFLKYKESYSIENKNCLAASQLTLFPLSQCIEKWIMNNDQAILWIKCGITCSFAWTFIKRTFYIRYWSSKWSSILFELLEISVYLQADKASWWLNIFFTWTFLKPVEKTYSFCPEINKTHYRLIK